MRDSNVAQRGGLRERVQQGRYSCQGWPQVYRYAATLETQVSFFPMRVLYPNRFYVRAAPLSSRTNTNKSDSKIRYDI